MRTEKIMVCVYNGPNGEHLIQRGLKLAHIAECPLYVLHVQTMISREFDESYQQYLRQWEQMTTAAGGQFLTRACDGRRAADVIAETAKEKHVTLLMVGQSVQTRWQEITRGCFANELLNQLGCIDLHIVPSQQVSILRNSQASEVPQYQAIGGR